MNSNPRQTLFKTRDFLTVGDIDRILGRRTENFWNFTNCLGVCERSRIPLIKINSFSDGLLYPLARRAYRNNVTAVLRGSARFSATNNSFLQLGTESAIFVIIVRLQHERAGNVFGKQSGATFFRCLTTAANELRFQCADGTLTRTATLSATLSAFNSRLLQPYISIINRTTNQLILCSRRGSVTTDITGLGSLNNTGVFGLGSVLSTTAFIRFHSLGYYKNVALTATQGVTACQKIASLLT